MDANLIINVVSIGLGIVGLAVAFHQSYKVKRVNSVVRDWGKDIYKRLSAAHITMRDLKKEIDSIDPVQWSHAKSQVNHAIGDQTSLLAQLSESMKVFVSNVTGDRNIDDVTNHESDISK